MGRGPIGWLPIEVWPLWHTCMAVIRWLWKSHFSSCWQFSAITHAMGRWATRGSLHWLTSHWNALKCEVSEGHPHQSMGRIAYCGPVKCCYKQIYDFVETIWIVFNCFPLWNFWVQNMKFKDCRLWTNNGLQMMLPYTNCGQEGHNKACKMKSYAN